MRELAQERMRTLERNDLFAAPPREWTLKDLVSIFRRRRGIVGVSVLTAITLAALYCVLATRRFQATGQVEVQKDSPGRLGLDRNMTGDPENGDADALDASMTLETEASILRSPTLALMVVKNLKLETTEDFYPLHKHRLTIPAWMFFWKKPVEPLSVPLDGAPNRRYVVLKIFASHLKVEQETGTRLIDVSYSSPDPQLASVVVNRLIAALQDYTFQSRFQATAQASAWLATQLSGLKKQTEDLQQAADRLQQGTGIYGPDASHNLVLARLEGLNAALSAAETNRILKQAIYEVTKSGDPELISGLAGNNATGANPAITNSLALLQTLRAQQASVQAEIDEADARYGSAYPKVAELHGELSGIDKSIHDEIGRIGERAHTDYEVAQSAEDAARDSFEKQKELATEANDRTVAYELARQEADASRGLYQNLLGKLKEAGVLEGLRSTNLTVVNAGMVPPTNHPHSPNVPLSFAAALAGGMFLGCAGALVREATDSSVHSIDDLERLLGVSVAGVVPRFRKAARRNNVPIENGELVSPSPFSLPSSQKSSQVILVTSAVPGDGKSGLAASLATSLARSGARVLLIDADLQCPTLHSIFGAQQTSGLLEALRTGTAADIHECPHVPGLSAVWAGDAATANSWNGAALLASPHLNALVQQWRTQFDYIVLDSAPVLPVPDAASLARLCDRTLLIVRYQATTMQAAQRGYRMIRRHLPSHAELDVVMNGLPKSSPDYFAYYGYRRSNHEQRARSHA